MRCTKPIRGYRGPEGSVKFDTREGYVGVLTEVSCGRCAGCRLRRSRDWAMRIMHEASLHDQNSFVTLTYNDANLPADGSLDVTHVQKFFKRVRKRFGPVRYYHCGEYGDDNERPHYHVCLFGLDFSKDRRHWKSVGGHRLYVSPSLDELWDNGFAVIGELTYESAAYVARYVLKKQHGERAEEYYRGRLPEYSTMSRRPGIGKKWFDQYAGEVYPADEVIGGGKPRRPPKYYDKLFEEINPDEYNKVMEKRRLVAQAHVEPWDRLKVIERVEEAKTKVFKREPNK